MVNVESVLQPSEIADDEFFLAEHNAFLYSFRESEVSFSESPGEEVAFTSQDSFLQQGQKDESPPISALMSCRRVRCFSPGRLIRKKTFLYSVQCIMTCSFRR